MIALSLRLTLTANIHSFLSAAAVKYREYSEIFAIADVYESPKLIV